MATIENFILRFKTEGTDGIKNASNDLTTLSQSSGGAALALGRLAGPIGLVASTLAAMGLGALKVAGDLSDLSGATGISAGALLNFKTSVIEAGGQTEDFQKIATKLNQSIQEAAGGSDKMGKAFKDLGVYVLDVNGKIRPTQDILQDITKKFQSGEISGAKYAAAIDILGKNASKLELSKLKAVGDAEMDKQVARLDKLNESLDKVKATLEKKVISFLGQLLLDMDKAQAKAAQMEAEANARGNTRVGAPGRLGGVYERPLTEEQKTGRENDNEMARLLNKPKIEITTPTKGKYQGVSEADIKAAAESEKRIFESLQNAKKTIALGSSNELTRIYINAEDEMTRATREINSRENLSKKQKAEEIAAKAQEISAKVATEVASFENAVDEKYRDERIARTLKEYEEEEAYRLTQVQATMETRRQSDMMTDQTDSMQGRFDLQQQILGLNETEQKRLTQLFELEELRKATLKEIADIKDLPRDERIAAEKKLNDEIAKRKGLINEEAAATTNRNRDFSAGFAETMAKYEESLSPLKRGEATANSVFNAMSSGIDKFVETGKVNFGDLASSIIMDLLKIQLKAAAVQLFNASVGAASGGGGILSLLGGFFAEGGDPPVGKASIVGEKGPELFIPKTAGTIIPNSALGKGTGVDVSGGQQTVNNYHSYSISAVDAKSVAQLFAENRMTMLGNIRQAEKEMPFRSR